MAWLIYCGAFLVGAIAGSFLNVVIHRGPKMWGLVDDQARRGNLAFPASYCPQCDVPLRAFDLVPIVSYIRLRGRCAQCHVDIPVRYLAVELAGAAAALGAFLIFGPGFIAVCVAVFLWLLIALAVIDFETGYLPDALTFTLVFVGLAVNMIDTIAPLPDALIGTVAGYLSFRVVGAIFHAVRGMEGLGQGDAKLLAGIGAWLGWLSLPIVVLAGALTGLAVAAIMRVRGHEISTATPIPFGPALAIGAVIALFATTL